MRSRIFTKLGVGLLSHEKNTVRAFKFRTASLKCAGAELLSSPTPVIDLNNLLLDLRLPSPCRRSITLAETFAASAISSLDEAGS